MTQGNTKDDRNLTASMDELRALLKEASEMMEVIEQAMRERQASQNG